MYKNILFQVSAREAIWISLVVFVLSLLTSSPVAFFTELKNANRELGFVNPGAFDHIFFCMEDLTPFGQVMHLNYFIFKLCLRERGILYKTRDRRSKNSRHIPTQKIQQLKYL